MLKRCNRILHKTLPFDQENVANAGNVALDCGKSVLKGSVAAIQLRGNGVAQGAAPK
jgi:hypothetical protein